MLWWSRLDMAALSMYASTQLKGTPEVVRWKPLDDLLASVTKWGRGFAGTTSTYEILDSGRQAKRMIWKPRCATVLREGDEQNKPLLNQINYVLVHLHLAGRHDLKPTYEELKEWLRSGQLDTIRIKINSV
jgi:hypothetical protein